MACFGARATIMSVISDYCQMRFSLCAGPQTTRRTAWPPANPLAPWGAGASHTPGQVGRPQSLSSATKNFM